MIRFSAFFYNTRCNMLFVYFYLSFLSAFEPYINIRIYKNKSKFKIWEILNSWLFNETIMRYHFHMRGMNILERLVHCVKIIRSAREKVTLFLPFDYKMHKQERRDQLEECAILYTTVYLCKSVIKNNKDLSPSSNTLAGYMTQRLSDSLKKVSFREKDCTM